MKLNPMTIYKGSWNKGMENKTRTERMMQTNKELREENVELLVEREGLQKEILREKQFKYTYLLFNLVFLILGAVMLYW